MKFLGVDPGKSGAVAIVNDEPRDGPQLEVFRCDETERDVFDFIYTRGRGGVAIIERVSAMPKQGVSSTFKFGMSYGFLRACLIAGGWSFEEVTPRKWQTAMGCLSGGDKNVTKARAQQLFPQIKVIHATADALLLAEYCRRTRTREDRP